MKILNPEDYIKNKICWRGCPDKVPTESVIRELLINSNTISDNYTYVDMNNACVTQHHKWTTYKNIVEVITNKQNRNMIFVCQSINPFIENINFYGNKVFSPHASTINKYISIPHYTPNLYEVKEYKDRKYLFSFLGANTHTIRKDICELYPNYCKLSNEWFDSSNISNYKEYLTASKFSLCPRGSGLGTLRLWESLGCGVIPVIISDNYKKPLDDKIKWSEFSVTIKESDISNIESILSNYTDNEILRMIENGLFNYNKYFKNDKLHQTIVETLMWTWAI